MKKVLSTIFCTALLIGTLFSPLTTSAKEKEKKVKEVVSNGEVTLEVTEDGQVIDVSDGAQIVSVHSYLEDGTVKEITVGEYVEKIKKQGNERKLKEAEVKKAKERDSSSSKRVPIKVTSTGEITPDCIACVGGVSTKYTESSYSNLTGSAQKATNYSYNCTLDNSTKSLSYSATKSHGFNVSLTSPEFSAFKAGVSYTFTSSATVSGTDTITIRPKYRGWFDFYPYLRKSSGYVRHYLGGSVTSSKWVVGTYPKLSSGKLSGDLVGKTSAMTSTQISTYCR
ncbi:hypothetical protein D1B31_08355 [Neobacillus notoginsengisoli]|uniref:Uncharacterized protein n=1 Tax=Neobacillus notoginsengisoli TaxID=1578198 RepID=A0A417YWF0_9BACI|nr:hypothetical protein [Neobacillus notoginsengisoli]RHW41712.1 hypothetical protein D1B31_08355 [Neobacillus notoginsengisoli]